MNRRVRSTAKPYRDPLMDTIEGMLNEWRREATFDYTGTLKLTSHQAIQVLIMDAFREPCYICDKPPDVVRVYFVPEELAKFGQKVIFYSLCKPCGMDISVPKKVKEKLAAELKDENHRMGMI